MVWVYLCKACEAGDHGHCELGHSCPSGEYGGSVCRCPCHGNAKWNTPAYLEDELQKIVQMMVNNHNDHLPDTDGPPQKIHLKKP